MYLQNKIYFSSDDIYEDMCEKIEKLKYMPGDSISENELCASYGVTRHSIRSALARLKQRRLVDVFPQRGTYVSLIDMGFIKNVLYLREAVEQEALYRIIKKDEKSELLNNLKECVKQQKSLEISKDSNDSFYKFDDMFHKYILIEVGEENVLDLISEHYIHVRRWRNLEVDTTDRMESLISEHEMIIESIEKGDFEIGRGCMHYHLDTIERYSEKIKGLKSEYFV